MSTMDVTAPEGWDREDYDGDISAFNSWEPLVSYEHRESETRVVVKPVVDIVPAAGSRLTVEDVTDRFSRMAHPSERRQTHWWRATEEERLPAVFPDAPITDERFDAVPWRLAIQPVWAAPEDRPDRFRPDTQKLPTAWFDREDRAAATSSLRSVLEGSPGFRFYDPPADPSERSVPARRF
jgi:hypothetical protein